MGIFRDIFTRPAERLAELSDNEFYEQDFRESRESPEPAAEPVADPYTTGGWRDDGWDSTGCL